MIPLQLQIKNFLSYGPDVQTIDFSSYHLICLSGKNGHGKSALLDAMTWVLWGQARKTINTARADQGLLRLGQLNMFVVFDFIFNGATYRVRREFSNYANKPQANLDFGLRNPTTHEIIPLTEKTIRTTQEKIDSLLNLDYDSFINSAFLRQGGSNEFSKKSPRERKQVLATILGLGHYERLRKYASDKAKERITHKTLLSSLYEKNVQAVTEHAPLKLQRMYLIDELAQLIEREKSCIALQAQLVEQEKTYLQKKEQASLVLFQQQQLETTIEQQRCLLRTTHATWQKLLTKLRMLSAQTDYYAERATIARAIQTMQDAVHEQIAFKQQILSCKELISKITLQFKENAQKNVQELTNKIHQTTLEIASCTRTLTEHTAHSLALEQEQNMLKTTIENLTLKIANSAQIQKEITLVEQQFEKRRTYYQLWITEGNWLSAEQKSIAEKQKLTQDDQNPSCPLCEQNLSASRKRFLKQTFTKREQFLTHRITRLQKILQRLKTLLFEQHAALTTLKKTADEYAQIKTQIVQLNQSYTQKTDSAQERIATAQRLEQQKDVLAKQLTQAKAHFSTASVEQELLMYQDTDYLQAIQNLRELEHKVSTHVYDATQHTQLIEQLKAIDAHIADRARIGELQAVKQQHEQTIQNICTLLRTLKEEQKKYALTQASMQELDQLYGEIQAQNASLASKLGACALEKNRLAEQKGRLDNEHEQLTRLEESLGEQKKVIDACEIDICDYQAIAHATSKEGIQALLIEDAIPEIEQEANHLLAKLTNNQAQIFIESLRDLKKGGTKETLDIKISDAIGIRPYELFSGGEAFRIDFALRIALSKLLARRAGTSLQTLIIDEGFGSQDEEGLSNIMEAIYKIQDDFAKIIIVSHLDTMKNQFPVHLHVEKGANGSRVQVIEQG